MIFGETAVLDEVKVGDTLVVADNGFTCLDEGQQCEVLKDENGEFYVTCEVGKHFLSGQLEQGQVLGFLKKLPELKEEMTFPQGGKTTTVGDIMRSLQDVPQDKVLCLHFADGWKNEQSFTDGAQKGMISGISQDHQNAYLVVGKLI